MNVSVRAIAIVLTLLPGAAFAQTGDLIVEKKTFELPSYTTVAGATIKSVKIGWESAGTLNADKSNAILITHYFSGTSHAFGKYAPSDAAAGYWDAIIGPGKAIDTRKYFVFSSDTLVNLNVNAANVVTTGPASINPDTGQRYGMSFPVVSFKDFVNVQKALVESLGIRRLRAVVGASGGGFQAYEWAASYPEMVDRIVPVISTPRADPYLIGWLDAWARPIRLDPKWNGGDYYDKEPPLEGLKAALKLVTLQAFQWEWAAKTFGPGPAEESKDPAKAMDNQFKIESGLENSCSRARQDRGCQSFPLFGQGQSAYVRRSGENQKARAAAVFADRSRISGAAGRGRGQGACNGRQHDRDRPVARAVRAQQRRVRDLTSCRQDPRLHRQVE